MPLHGNFACMPLPDVLQWLGNAWKTGELRLERKQVSKRILVEHGRIVACGSDEPAERIGHFLLSRGRITEDHLRRALALQEKHPRQLDALLLEMGAISEEELIKALEQKAEETIFSLFEWDDAEFHAAHPGPAGPDYGRRDSARWTEPAGTFRRSDAQNPAATGSP